MAVGSTASIVRDIYDRLKKARGVSRGFQIDIEQKFNYIIQMAGAYTEHNDRLLYLIARTEEPNWNGGEDEIVAMTNVLRDFTTVEAGLGHLKSTGFFENNRAQLQKMKAKDHQAYEAFYEAFANMTMKITRKCAEIDTGVNDVKSALRRAWFTNHEAVRELQRLFDVFDSIVDDLQTFIDVFAD